MSERLSSFGSGSNIPDKSSIKKSEIRPGGSRLSRISDKIKRHIAPAAFAVMSGVTGSAAYSAGCSPEGFKNSDENTAAVRQALLTGWDAPSIPSFVSSELHSASFIDVNGSQVTVYYNSRRPGSLNGSTDVWKVTGTDNGDKTITWGAPAQVPGVNTTGDEGVGLPCDGHWYQVGADGMLKECDWDGTNVSACSDIPGGVNYGMGVIGLHCDAPNHNLYASSVNVSPSYPNATIYKGHIPQGSEVWDGGLPGDIGASWVPMTNCSPANFDVGDIFITGQEALIGTNWLASHGGWDINYLNWSGTDCTGSPQDIGSNVNDVNSQRSPIIDAAGRLWYTYIIGTNVQIMMAWPVSAPDGGAGGTAGSGGTGGTITTGGSGGTITTGGSGGETPTGGSGGSITTGGSGGSGLEGGGGAGATGGSGGETPTGGSGGSGGVNTGGSGGINTGGSGGSGLEGGGGAGATGGSGGSGGGPNECPITVTVNSGDCEIVNCENMDLGEIVSLNATNADCEFEFGDYATFSVKGTGNSGVSGAELYPAESLDEYDIWENPNHNPKMNRIYVLSSEIDYLGGMLGTRINGNMEVRDGIEGFRTMMLEDSMEHKVRKNGQTVSVSTVDFGQGPGVQTEGNEVFLSKADLLALGETIGETPDAGPPVTPPGEEDDGGCSIATVSPTDVSSNINGWVGLVLAGGAMARRRSSRKED